MPEIAEVRTVARTLNSRLCGKKIIGADFLYDKIIEGDKETFKESILNRIITRVDNYGKWLFIILGDKAIMSHLRMEGKYFIKPTDEVIEKHEHIIMHLDDGTDLRYHDTRKFGRMCIVDTNEIYKHPHIAPLGIEPDNKALTGSYIYANIHSSSLPIKTLLLDQSIINGLGNIYADEVLFASGINPLKEGKKLTINECEKIKEAGCKIIKRATELGGSTIRSYISSLGVYGHYQDELCVHTKANLPCPICGTEITKTRVGGRGTYFCSKCQK